VEPGEDSFGRSPMEAAARTPQVVPGDDS
jgi:hypothetical protein